MKKLDFLKITFLIRKDKMIDGHGPVYMQLFLEGKRSYITTNYRTEVSKWDSKNGKFIGNTSGVYAMNELLERMRFDAVTIYNEMRSRNQDITVDLLRLKLKGEGEIKRKTLLEVCNLYNSNAEKLIDIEFGKITHGRYLHCAKIIEKFILHKFGLKDIILDSVKYSFAIEFEYFLKTEIKLHQNTLIKYIQYLNRVMDFAVQYEWLDRNVMSTFKCSTVETKKEYLTQAELDTLQYKEIDIDRLSEIRDVFVFCCYTGYAYIDVVSLTKDNIVTGINGMKWIYTSRQKTKHTANVPLMQKAEEIIEKYSDHPDCIKNGTVLPTKSNQRTNTYLKELADICGIKKPLTTHIARHTFATTVLLSNGVSMESTSKMLGHKSIKTTQIYGKILETRVGAEMEILNNKLFAPKAPEIEKKVDMKK